MKITKTIEGNTTTYFYDGVRKYGHFKDSNGLESWSEYKDGKEIHYKNSDGMETWREYKDGEQIHFKSSTGNEWWSDDNPEIPESSLKEEDIRPFEFGNQIYTMKTNEKEKQLFDMIYQWGRIGLKTDENCNAFQELLSEIIETKYEQELKIADDRWKRAEELNQQTL